MAKSTRSKVKRAWRSQKRESGVYAAAEAARLHRLNEKLSAVLATKPPQTERPEDDSQNQPDVNASEMQESVDIVPDNSESMEIDSQSQPRKISTHGPRNSRREEWRASKGLTPKPKIERTNRQGIVAARRRAGRSKRRR